LTDAIRIWYCAAVAVVAASLADAAMESASNAGLFGRGAFTDHSFLDIAPALAIGLTFVVLNVWFRARRTLALATPRRDWPRIAGDALGRNVLRLVPPIWSAQIAVLYVMETIEQHVVYGHVLGGFVWLGGPIVVSLIVHGAVCVLVAAAAAKSLRAFAAATVLLVRLVQALASLPARAAQPAFLSVRHLIDRRRSFGALGRIGERAPPILAG
jgi:hypothetical protein